jgi:hypothetical protein
MRLRRQQNMGRQSRRAILKTMAALPSMALLSSLPQVLPLKNGTARVAASNQLNVIFHGVFLHIYDQTDPNWITAYAPTVLNHEYIAGDWGRESENPLDKTTTYELSGHFLGKGVAPTKGETAYPVITCDNGVDANEVACQIRFPLPTHIVGLRRIHRVLSPILIGTYAPRWLTHLPMAYAFVYHYDPNSVDPVPTLTGSSWKAPKRIGTVNLHVRAESEVEGMGGNGFEAIRRVLGYSEKQFDINPTYSTCMVGPDRFPPVHGIQPEEEYFLPELLGTPSDIIPPGSPQDCSEAKFQPVNCSTTCGILSGKR